MTLTVLENSVLKKPAPVSKYSIVAWLLRMLPASGAKACAAVADISCSIKESRKSEVARAIVLSTNFSFINDYGLIVEWS